MLTCLLESIDVDDDVTPIPAGRRRPVRPAVTEEPNLRPAHTTAFGASKLGSILWWAGQTKGMALLSSELALSRTSSFKVTEPLVTQGPPSWSVSGVLLKRGRVKVKALHGLFELIFVALLGAMRQPRSFRELPIEHLFWKPVVGHSAYVSRPPQLGSCENSFDGFQFSSV